MSQAVSEQCTASVQELEGTGLDVAMAQHLLVAADRFCLARLRRICERRLCESVEVSLKRLNPKHLSPKAVLFSFPLPRTE